MLIMSDDFPQPNKEFDAAAAIEPQAEQSQQLEMFAEDQVAEAAEELLETAQPMESVEPTVESTEAGDGMTAEVYAEAIDTNDEEADPFDGTSDDDDFDDLEESEEEEEEGEEEDEDELEEGEDELEEDEEDLDEDDDAFYDLDADDEDESLASADFDASDDVAPVKPKRARGAAAKGSNEIVASDSDMSDDGDNDPSPQAKPKRDHTTHVAKFEPQRLAKILAASGLDARRKCEEYVTAGRVTVDGEVITDLAFRADPYSQKIALDGERIKQQRKVYFILNKPRGVVCSNNDPQGRPRILDMFPEFVKERMFTIGRLDSESEGLILVTNDGELANRMAHPRYRVPKFYLCHVKGVPSSDTLAALKRGMYFEEGRFSVEGVRMKKTMGDSAYLDIVLNEGQNREIRRLLAKVDHKVMRLKRVGFGPIRLGDMPSGAFRPLTNEESKLLKNLSEQRAHLDKAASRGRKSRGPKPPYGIKKPFGSKPGFGSKPAYGKPAVNENAEFPVKRSYSDKLRSRQISTSQEDRPPQRRLVEASESDDAMPSQNERTSEGRFDNRPPQSEYVRSPRGGNRQPPRRDQSNDDSVSRSLEAEGEFTPQRNEGSRPQSNRPQSSGYNQRPQSDEDRPPRRYSSSGEGQSNQSERESLPPRQYGYRPQQGGSNQRSQNSQSRPPRQYPSRSEGQSFQSEGDSSPPRRYGNQPQQGGYNQRSQGEYNQRPQYGNDRPPRRYQSDDSASSNQAESSDNDSDFNGGRRRFNNQDQGSGYTPRPQGQRPPQREGGYSQRPPQGQGQGQGRPPQGRPPQRRYGSQEGTGGGGNSGQRRYGSQEGTGGGYSGQRRYGSQGGGSDEQSGGASGQRRPAGNRGYSQGDNQSGPPRGRGRPPARPPRPTTADGKEILEGKVTGYRTPPKEGIPRRPYKAVLGMKGSREQRQQRRKKD